MRSAWRGAGCRGIGSFTNRVEQPDRAKKRMDAIMAFVIDDLE